MRKFTTAHATYIIQANGKAATKPSPYDKRPAGHSPHRRACAWSVALFQKGKPSGKVAPLHIVFDKLGAPLRHKISNVDATLPAS